MLLTYLIVILNLAFLSFVLSCVEGWNLLCDNVDYTKARRNCSLSMSVIEWFQTYN
jgi:hypothetical protein